MFSFAHDAAVDVLLAIPLIGAYIVFALGIVVIFRASRVLNLAHGAMAMAPAYVYYQLTAKWHLPVLVGLVIGVAAGGALGVAVERIFVRPLRRISPTAQTVGTVAAFGLVVAIVAKVFGTLAVLPPSIFPRSTLSIGGTVLTAGAIGLFVVGLLVAVALYAFFRFTDIGLAMRAAADNRRAASLMGVDPARTTTMAWLLGGATAALAGILLAAATSLEPYTLSLQALPGFVTVLIGGLESLLGAILGGAVVGAVIGLVPIVPLIGSQQGAPQLALMLLAFVVMALRGQRFSSGELRSEGVIEERATTGRTTRRRGAIGGDLRVLGIGVLLVFPVLPFVNSSVIGDAGLAAVDAIVAVSLVLLIGLVGQISLAQASFVGLSGFLTGIIVEHLHIPFPATLPLAAAGAGLAAAALGLVALRVRGLYLAVATLIFAWMCDSYLFAQSWLAGEGGSRTVPSMRVGPPHGFPSFDFTDRRTFYYASIAVVALVAVAMSLLRRSKTGRALFAIRGSEVAAASLGINVVRYKLLAFGMAGVIAGMAGNLIATNAGVVTASQFSLNASLFYLSVAVVGGLASVGGAVAAGVLFAVINEVFFRVEALNGYLDIVSSALLITVLLAYPGGLAAIPATFGRIWRRVEPPVLRALHRLDAPRAAVREVASRGAQRVVTLVPRRSRAAPAYAGSGTQPAGSMTPRERLLGLVQARERMTSRGRDDTAPLETPAPGGSSNGHATDRSVKPESRRPDLRALVAAAVVDRATPLRREDRDVMLRAEHVIMRFGGLIAVDDVSLEVRDGEIVGLIGPNGAGKTTTFNCISGLLVPTSGRVSLLGADVTRTPVHERAKRGLGRTFQVIQLFPQLTVFENLLVATHGGNRTTVLSHLFVTPGAVQAERSARDWVGHVIDLLGLGDVAMRPAAGLPFGVLRMVELARALVTGAQVIMLDEPASGLDNSETERLADLLLTLRVALGLSLLLIEHDVKMVTSVSDYMYVLDRGRLLAEGTARDVQRNPEVIAAYLGEPATAGVA